ncbi:head GIN domain-containing protein [Portibacter lacus]|uniref:DUF2807 domain-containing protein n=1 Tax=Portibacter lacus TaxID=1099794 RepID=A0AA37SR59_9BACT|nr:head GIN domain-containing protein [Portibacter lacus]GLR19276.1 DUF2807 domain-containing protein [Portibacter lacus]
MKKINIAFIAAIIGIVSFTSCEKELFGCISGKGEKETRIVSFEKIEGFDVDGSNNVIIMEGDEQLIEITSYPNIIDRWIEDSSVEDGILRAGIRRCVTGFKKNDIEIRATISSLKLVAISGSGDVETVGTFENVDDLEIDISGSGEMDLDLGDNMDFIDIKVSGSGNIKISGANNETEIRVSGSGKIRNFDLVSQSCSVRVSGSGDAEVNVVNDLEVKITGSGDVCYKGQPIVNSNITGSGNIKNCN